MKTADTFQQFYADLKENLHLERLDIDDIQEIVNSTMYFEDCNITGDSENLIVDVKHVVDYIDNATFLNMLSECIDRNISVLALYCLICMLYFGPEYTNVGVMEMLILSNLSNYYYLGFRDTTLKTLKNHPEYFVNKNSSCIDTPDKVANLDFKIVTGD